MEEKVRYQYTYFIYPFEVKDYEKYIYSLLKNKNVQTNLFDKEKDIELYTYFTPNVRNYFFETIEWEKSKRKKFQKAKDILKKDILKHMKTCMFSYAIEKGIQGKVGEGDLFFTIDEIKIICTKTRRCLLLMKTHIENVKDIDQVINFNYKFREINTIPEELKNHDKIRIQTTQFETTKNIQTLIQEIIKQEEIPMPYVHSYLCVDSENWYQPNDFDKIEYSFKKFINLQPKSSNFNLGLPKDIVFDSDYIKIATSKEGIFLITSSTKTENYTKLPILFEEQYLYTYLIGLGQQDILKNSFDKSSRALQQILVTAEITTDELGSNIYKQTRKIWDIDNMEKRIKEYVETLSKKEEIEKNKRWNKILTVILTISIILNIFNMIVNLKIL